MTEEKPEKPLKKASEIIVELDDKVNTMMKMMSNLNANMMLVLSRLNEEAKRRNASNPVKVEQVQEELSPLPIAVSSKPVQMRRSPPSESQTVPSTGKKVPVFQSVTDAQQRLIFLADVEVISDEKTLVVKTKTTAAGKWQAALKPGKYTVHILKKENSTRKRTEYRAEFLVKDIVGPLEIPTAVLKEVET